MMQRWLPSPLLSLALLATWLLVNQSLAPAHWLLGGLLAIAAPLLTQPLRPFVAVVKKPLVAVRLLSWSLYEITRSCFNVARIILFNKTSNVNSQFIHIPLDLKDPNGLALLSCLINTTPGTVWVEIRPENHELLIHIFDLHDPQEWVHIIKTRYEKPIMEIFE